MGKVSKQVENAIKEALRLEINGREFYNHAAEITLSELGKKTFQRLAEEEDAHLEAFGKLFSEVLTGEDWKKHIREEEIRSKAPLIERLKESTKKEKGQGELEALRLGMELERNAIDHFQNAAEKADDPKAKEIFVRVGEQETLHYDLLQAQYDSVTKTGFWFDVAEFYMDGKY